MSTLTVLRVLPDSPLWHKLILYSRACGWIAGPHLAETMEHHAFQSWEAVFCAMESDEIVGFCTLLETDYYPENRYSPWISSIFVDKSVRGRRISQHLVDTAAGYARSFGFQAAYIPSDITGLYEKYGFLKIDSLVNYAGDEDFVFEKKLL